MVERRCGGTGGLPRRRLRRDARTGQNADSERPGRERATGHAGATRADRAGHRCTLHRTRPRHADGQHPLIAAGALPNHRVVVGRRRAIHRRAANACMKHRRGHGHRSLGTQEGKQNEPCEQSFHCSFTTMGRPRHGLRERKDTDDAHRRQRREKRRCIVSRSHWTHTTAASRFSCLFWLPLLVSLASMSIGMAQPSVVGNAYSTSRRLTSI